MRLRAKPETINHILLRTKENGKLLQGTLFRRVPDLGLGAPGGEVLSPTRAKLAPRKVGFRV